MVTEIAILNVRLGAEPAFEESFKIAGRYISTARGYLGHNLKKCLEHPNQYLLIVYWEKLEDHEIGFRGSEAYSEWKKLLHHYYDPFPTVEHYDDIIDVKPNFR